MTTPVAFLVVLAVGAAVCFVVLCLLIAFGLCRDAARGDEWVPRCTPEDEARLSLYPEVRR